MHQTRKDKNKEIKEIYITGRRGEVKILEDEKKAEGRKIWREIETCRWIKGEDTAVCSPPLTTD